MNKKYFREPITEISGHYGLQININENNPFYQGQYIEKYRNRTK